MNTIVQHTRKPDRKPPISERGLVRWMSKNLFSSISNSIITVVLMVFLAFVFIKVFNWAIWSANWSGTDRSVCDANKAGACWTFIRIRFDQLMFGLYYAAHPDQIWRPVSAFGILISLVGLLFIKWVPFKKIIGGLIIAVYPFIAFGLIHGAWFGLPVAETSEWGGFMLTLILACIGIIAALPIGLVLALGRRSELPIIKSLSVIYIEFWRGVPLITILFMASVMLPLFLPSEMDIDKVVRALVGITMFQSAYIAEAIRGGLQAIPKGQYEAAQSLGLGYWKTISFIIMPQALRISIPSIVNTFIALFKDTSLVSIIALSDLLRMSERVSRSAEWKGYDIEAYVFAALLFGVCCYSMSLYSRTLEAKLDTGYKR